MRKMLLIVIVVLAYRPARGQLITPDARTPAEQKLDWARAEVKAHPDQPQPYNDLAVAFIARARETGDAGCYNEAEAALQHALKREPQNIEALKAEAMILLGRHEIQKAIELTRKLKSDNPDDVLIHGFLADALIETGNYGEAVEETQWMLNLRPGNVPGLLRAARLRWIYRDREGALDLYTKAYQQISPTQTEDQAWTLTQMADIQIDTGHLDIADQLLQSALNAFPGYHLSRESSARLEAARKRSASAGPIPQMTSNQTTE